MFTTNIREYRIKAVMHMFIADAHCDTLYETAIKHTAREATVITSKRLKRGGVCLQTLAMFAGSEGMKGAPYDAGKTMLSAADELGIPIIRGSLPKGTWDDARAILSIEGGEMLEGSLERLDEFARAGVRLIALT